MLRRAALTVFRKGQRASGSHRCVTARKKPRAKAAKLATQFSLLPTAERRRRRLLEQAKTALRVTGQINGLRRSVQRSVLRSMKPAGHEKAQ